MNHPQDEKTYEWVCDRPTVPPVIGGRKSDTETEHDPGPVALRRGMRARAARIRFDHWANR